jgi:poly-gamma-glutamate synthesis protein (capsule biosynthesis protein)
MRNTYKAHAMLLLLCLASVTMAQAQSLKVIFAGDLMGHGPQHKAARTADSSYDYTPCFRFVEDYIKSADLAIVNLEVTLAGPPYTGYPQFSSPRELALAAKNAGFDIMTTANNHCMDRGKEGLERTLRVLDTLGIPHLGTYRDREQHDLEHPLMVERNGVRLALLCYTYGTNGIEVQQPNVVNFIDTLEMARDLRVAKEKGADFVITLIHWGIEYALKANAEQEQTARWLLERGCDAVIGGHPHVVQNFTLDANLHNDRYPEIVVYSMGNLVSNQRDVNCDGGIMIELDLQKNFFDTRVVGCRYMPYWVHRGTFDGLYQYYIVPSTDAVEYPDSYQVSGDLLQALQRFSTNTRIRLDSCALSGGANIFEHRFYHNRRPELPADSLWSR